MKQVNFFKFLFAANRANNQHIFPISQSGTLASAPLLVLVLVKLQKLLEQQTSSSVTVFYRTFIIKFLPIKLTNEDPMG